MTSKKELISRAEKPGEDALKLHPYYRGKIEVALKCCVRDFQDFAIWYTPGVAEPCMAINRNKKEVYRHTNKANNVAVVSDGSRVLGLGDIGPEASLPVMEGKALLFKYLGGVDAFPICLDTKDPEEIIKTVKYLQPTFGGINLEDIANPKCFYILERLRAEMDIPVWHDDQQGTAAVTLAGLINALRVVGKKIEDVKVTLVGAGAANISIARMIIIAGVKPEHIYVVDSSGILNKERQELKTRHKEKWELCLKTNGDGRRGGIPEALAGVDVLIALSKPGPGTIRKEWIAQMNRDAVVFACANPNPEIWPWEAKEAGARIVATGRSDFPNQINNSLMFPGIFRGALDVQARTITDEMCAAAAYELADTARDRGLAADSLLPTMDDWEVFPRLAAAVAMQALKQKVARTELTGEEVFQKADGIIKRSRELTAMMMERKFIKLPEEEEQP